MAASNPYGSNSSYVRGQSYDVNTPASRMGDYEPAFIGARTNDDINTWRGQAALMQLGNQYNYQMWLEQKAYNDYINEYNSPLQQRQRLEEAGYSPYSDMDPGSAPGASVPSSAPPGSFKASGEMQRKQLRQQALTSVLQALNETSKTLANNYATFAQGEATQLGNQYFRENFNNMLMQSSATARGVLADTRFKERTLGDRVVGVSLENDGKRTAIVLNTANAALASANADKVKVETDWLPVQNVSQLYLNAAATYNYMMQAGYSAAQARKVTAEATKQELLNQVTGIEVSAALEHADAITAATVSGYWSEAAKNFDDASFYGLDVNRVVANMNDKDDFVVRYTPLGTLGIPIIGLDGKDNRVDADGIPLGARVPSFGRSFGDRFNWRVQRETGIDWQAYGPTSVNALTGLIEAALMSRGKGGPSKISLFNR